MINLYLESTKEKKKISTRLPHNFSYKISPDKIKQEEKEKFKFSNYSCDQIKKLGKQRDYCENKFIAIEGKEKKIECLKNFCLICCESETYCSNSCLKAHSLYESNDPEELLTDVCSYKNMGKTFLTFCDNLIKEKNIKEYEECFNNVCFDCCSNELRVTDFNDQSIIKCLRTCLPPNNGQHKSFKYEENFNFDSNVNKSDYLFL